MRRCETKNMASSYKQAPDNTPSEEATVDLAIGGMNLGAPPDAMVRPASLPAQNGGSGHAQAGKPRDTQDGEPGDAQTNTSFIQQTQHDSKGSEGCDASTQPSYHQEPSMVSRSNDKELQDVYVAVMGVTGTGKSTFIKKLTGKEVNINDGLLPCSADVEEYTFVYNARYKVHLIDTPGFDDTMRKDIAVLRDISGWLGEAYANDIKLSGLIYLHRIIDNKMTGTARKNLFMFKELCGPDCFPKVCLVTTMWEDVNKTTGNMRERELIETEDFWGYMARHGSQVHRHMNTRESAMSILETLIEDKQEIVLEIQKELVNGVRLDNTGAGKQLNEALDEIKKQHEQDLKKCEKDKQAALRRRDAESVEQIEELQRENAQKLEQMAQDRKNTEVDMARLLEEREQEVRKLEEENTRYSQKLQKKREQLKEMRRKGEENLEQARVLSQEIEEMEQKSERETRKVNQKREWLKKPLKWVGEHREELESALLVANLAGAMTVMKAAR